jgi:glucokinase
MAIASAGVVLDEEVINSNLPWRISLPEMRRELGLRELHVINDFAAAAHGSQCLDPADSRLLTPGVETAAPGPALVIGPGTGLGAAICIPHPRGTVVLPTEVATSVRAGQRARSKSCAGCSSAPAMSRPNSYLRSRPGQPVRRICAIDGADPVLRAPAAISDAARRGDTAPAMRS